ncbi:cytochrome b/b6 domain-containing protein [Azospirillum rugosum]|uniref:Cytochrome b n=1 Tax=Azospirillum rugosum TaxID=416170 RepID=A0ABS4SSB1_9PROT|nr:cytochrome b/b6 domain-containing protein [Azospirillum rugosum]MBP2295449.1 cytochrome b [Azospirillum rugosum]MDQ0528328.1 cytochrome b [Azospirillum rugosum]
MTTIDVSAPGPAKRRPLPGKTLFLLAFHATLSGAFLVSWLTGDEDTYGMHQFAGYTVLAALAVRLAAAWVAPSGPLRLPRPSAGAAMGWMARLLVGDPRARVQRSPLLAWMAMALLAVVGGAALTGAVADFATPVERLHEAVADWALAVVIAHLALVFALHALKTAAARRAVRLNRTESSVP